MVENKTLSFHKESYGLGQLIILLASSFLGGVIGLCVLSPIIGVLTGLVIGIVYAYYQNKKQYACPECGSDFQLTKVDKESRHEEWTCSACKRRLIAEFN